MPDEAPTPPSDVRVAAGSARAWPFVEARTLVERFAGRPPENGHVLFETGYGPSGLPHIGTFGEVVRTSMVRHAFAQLSDLPTRLLAFSDDMDALRSVPGNVPNREMLTEHLGRPLTAVPDPFGTHASFGEHNNARLRAFLDRFGFAYEFASATDYYKGGRFDAALRTVLKHYDAVANIVLPTLRAERQATYSPFLPVCAKTGRVLQVPLLRWDAEAGTIAYVDEDGEEIETSVTGGRCKLQWKVDWAMRWAALGVDYEMAGKDLIDSVRLSSQICRIIGGVPPAGFNYELFLDERGEKISKSRGNGLSVDDWLRYGPEDSLTLFMFQKPRSAKRLYFDVIPKNVDDYIEGLTRFPHQELAARLENPVWHIHRGQPPRQASRLSYSILLNLVTVCHTEDKAVLWRYITSYDPVTTPESAPLWDRLLDFALAYYRDFVKPCLRYRAASAAEKEALADLSASLRALPVPAEAEAIQSAVYEVGKRHAVFPDLRAWFRSLYQILLGQDDGPRMGTFIALYGREPTLTLIDRAIAGEDLAAGG